MERPTAPFKFVLAIGITTAVLAACSSNNEQAGLDDESPPAPASAEKTNAPLKADQVNIAVNVVEGPVYDAGADQLRVTVALVNNGKVNLPVTGVNPVILGVVQKVPNTNDLPDKRGSESRAAFSTDIGPTETGEVEVTLPVGFVIGNKVEFDALQEGIAWFGFSYDQPTAVIGPFKRCEGGTGICDDQGKPIPAL